MTKLKLIFFLAVIIVLSSCTAKKRIAEFDAQPEWVKQKPTNTAYYIGVGSAKKIGTPAEYIEKSRSNAMADLAGEVSFQISSISVLHTIETQFGNSDLFDQHIEIITDDYLEGFEPVNSFENENTYWSYYRIKKTVYRETKERRKKEAVDNARAKYLSGNNAKENVKPGDAISFYLKGLEAIKKYMAEDTPVDIGGKTIDIGNELFSALNNVISHLEIKPFQSDVFIRRGESFDQPLEFLVFYDSNPIKGISVSFSYTGGYLKNNYSVSNVKGRAYAEPGSIQSKNGKEQLIAFIELNDIAQKATDDLFVRGLIINRKIKPASIQLNISSPKLTIEIEKDFCRTDDCGQIVRLFEKNALHEGYLIDTIDYDYMFKLDLRYTSGEKAGSLISVNIEGILGVFNTEPDLIWTNAIDQVTGVGNSIDIARKEAFETLLKNLNLIYFRKGLTAID